MATNRPIQDVLNEALEPVGGTIQDLSIERRQWLSKLVPNRSVLDIRLIEGGKLTGVYLAHDDLETITISGTSKMETIGWMLIDGIDQLA